MKTPTNTDRYQTPTAEFRLKDETQSHLQTTYPHTDRQKIYNRDVKMPPKMGRYQASTAFFRVMRAELFDGKLALLTNTPYLTPAENRPTLQGVGLYRARFPRSEVRYRNSTRSSQVAGSHPRTCADLLSRIRAQPRHVDTPKSWRT